MQVNSRALIPFGIWVVVALLLLKVQASGADLAVRIALWTMFGLMSVVAIVRMARGRHMRPYSQADTMPERIRRWALGESSAERKKERKSD